MKICSVEGCERKHLAKGMCGKHWQANSKYGDPLATAAALGLADRFWSKVDKSGECWIWTASLTSTGYGQFSRSRRLGPEGAHRVSYRLTYGSIPEGKHLDHRCHNTLCVRPDHLRPVTPKQNLENLAGAHRDSKTGVRGVTLAPSGTYRVAAFSNGTRRQVSGFISLEEAERAAIELRNELMTHNDADRMAS